MMPSKKHVRLPPLRDMDLPLHPPGGLTQLARQVQHQRHHAFETVVLRSRDTVPGTPFSPISLASPFVPSWESNNLDSDLPVKTLSVPDSKAQRHSLTVPDLAHISAGGWFDPSNWLFQIMLNHVGHKSVEELLHDYFYRENRPEYGDDHTSTRGNRLPDHDSVYGSEAGDYHSDNRRKASENHKVQERERRVRHRVLQKEADHATPTLVYDLAEDMLPDVKEHIRKMPKEEAPPIQDRKIRKTGKDEQLTSAALMSHFSSILIFKQAKALQDLKEDLRRAKEELDTERAVRIQGHEQIHVLGQESKRFADELAALHSSREGGIDSRRSSTISRIPSQLTPVVATQKRPVTAVEDSVSTNPSSSMQAGQHKRLRLEHMLQPPLHRHFFKLPPSPSPDCEDQYVHHSRLRDHTKAVSP